MPKLKKFKKNKISTKNILISFAVIMGIMMITIISKSYAIYKLQQDYDLIKNKIGSFTMGDVRVAVLVDGKEASEFPSYETNYKVEGIECTNGVKGEWDTENWRLIIDDMSATSTKCTVSFDSTKTNSIIPIAYSKKELLALNDEVTTVAAALIIDKIYPVGSIYMSTSDDTVEKVQNKFGGTWVKYSSGTTLVGDDGETYIANDEAKGSGGASSVTLNSSDIPSLSVSGTTNSTGSGYKIGYTSTTRTSTIGNSASYRLVHQAGTKASYNHVVGYASGTYADYNDTNYPMRNHAHNYADYYANSITGIEAHTHTFSGNYTNDAQTNVNVQDPYTVVYMYKRTA